MRVQSEETRLQEKEIKINFCLFSKSLYNWMFSCLSYNKHKNSLNHEEIYDFKEWKEVSSESEYELILILIYPLHHPVGFLSRAI